jgi:hypothetical protein
MMFKRIWLALLIGTMACAAQAQLSLANIGFMGKVSGEYELFPVNPRAAEILQPFRTQKVADDIAASLNTQFYFRQDLTIRFASCEQGAFYNPTNRTVTVCAEFLDLIGRFMNADTQTVGRMSPEERQRHKIGAVLGVLYHELAHALIHINQVPVTGREEDVADQFAFYYSHQYLEKVGQPVVGPTTWFFVQLAKQRNQINAGENLVRRLLADEHSLDMQRVYNLACWAYGTQEPGIQSLAFYVGLPQERAVRCPAEYQQLANGINSQFGMYLKR